MFPHLLLALAAFSYVMAEALSFDLPALGQGNTINKRCFSIYIGRDVMSTGQYTSTPSSGSKLSFEITDPSGNILNSRSDAKDIEKFSFTSHAYSDYNFCFYNILNPGTYPNPSYARTITFTINIGAQAQDSSELASKENLKPIEVELRVLEQVIQSIADEMEYLKEREARMRDTNESTNTRVKMFSFLSIGALIGSGIWQIFYLKSFFQSKKIL